MSLPKLYPILDTALLERLNVPLLEAAIGMIEAGAHTATSAQRTFLARSI